MSITRINQALAEDQDLNLLLIRICSGYIDAEHTTLAGRATFTRLLLTRIRADKSLPAETKQNMTRFIFHVLGESIKAGHHKDSSLFDNLFLLSQRLHITRENSQAFFEHYLNTNQAFVKELSKKFKEFDHAKRGAVEYSQAENEYYPRIRAICAPQAALKATVTTSNDSLPSLENVASPIVSSNNNNVTKPERAQQILEQKQPIALGKAKSQDSMPKIATPFKQAGMDKPSQENAKKSHLHLLQPRKESDVYVFDGNKPELNVSLTESQALDLKNQEDASKNTPLVFVSDNPQQAVVTVEPSKNSAGITVESLEEKPASPSLRNC